MRIVKFGHACVRLEDAGRVLVIDPGGFTEPEAVDGADAVLVTHEHPDHLDPDRLRRSGAAVWTNAAVAAALGAQAPDLSERLTVVGEGDSFTAGGFPISVHGSEHALIHADIPRVANSAYLVDDAVYHPGDSFTPPPRKVETLLVPIHAPWMPVRDAVDFARAHAGSRAVAIHDGLLNDNGVRVVSSVFDRLLAASDLAYVRLPPGSDV